MNKALEKDLQLFKRVVDRVKSYVKEHDNVVEFRKLKANEEVVSNYLIVDSSLNLDDSSLASPSSSLFKVLASGSFQFNMNWTDLFKMFKSLTIVSKSKIVKSKVLDVGCKFSDFALFCYRNRVDIEYHGIDIDFYELLKSAENNYTTSSSYFYCLNVNEDFKNFLIVQKFDFILMFDIVEHVGSKRKGINLLKKAFDLLSDGGELHITTPNAIDGEIQYPNDHLYEFELQELKDALLEIGFKTLKVNGTNCLERHLKKCPEDKVHLLNNGYLSSIIGCRNASIATEIPEINRHVFIRAIK